VPDTSDWSAKRIAVYQAARALLIVETADGSF
jgi:hypothetical protein